jgi:hypothetical protein
VPAAAAGTTTGADCYENHVGTLDGSFDFVYRFFGGSLAGYRVSAGAQSLGSIMPDMYLGACFGVVQRLGISVNDNKLYALDSGFDHTIDGRAARAANPYNFYPGKCFYWG